MVNIFFGSVSLSSVVGSSMFNVLPLVSIEMFQRYQDVSAAMLNFAKTPDWLDVILTDLAKSIDQPPSPYFP